MFGELSSGSPRRRQPDDAARHKSSADRGNICQRQRERDDQIRSTAI
jgi:hypothetical protein